MWRKRFDSCVEVLNFDTDWLTGIKLSQNNKTYVILCVPYESVDNCRIMIVYTAESLYWFNTTEPPYLIKRLPISLESRHTW